MEIGSVYKISWWENTTFIFKCNRIEESRYVGEVLDEDLRHLYDGFVVLDANMKVELISNHYCYHKFVEMPLFTGTYTKCEKCGEVR